MKQRQIIILGVIIFSFTAMMGTIMSGKKGDDGKDKEEKEESSIVYVRARKAVVNDYIDGIHGYGRVSNHRQVAVSSEVQGRILDLGKILKPGESVKKGQLLFQIDNTEASLALKGKKSLFLQKIATVLPDIKLDYGESLAAWSIFFQHININKSLPGLPPIKTKREKNFIAAKGIVSDYFSIKMDESRLNKYSIIAPLTGKLITVSAEPGGVINPGTPLATIISTDDLEITMAVGTQDINSIFIGQKAYAITETNDTIETNVRRIAGQVNEKTQSVDVYHSISKRENFNIYGGMFLDVIIPQDSLMDVFKILRKELQFDSYLYVVKDSSLFMKDYQVVKHKGEYAFIKGLNEGEMIMVGKYEDVADSVKIGAIEL